MMRSVSGSDITVPHGNRRPARRAVDARAPAIARRYGEALRAADRSGAEQVVDDALNAGMAPAAVHSFVVEPAMIEIGEQWESSAITVADEHLATAITHQVLIRLLDGLRVARAGSRERVLLAAVQGQHHVLGLRMVADVLEGAGFDVLYLGSDVPVDSLRRFVAEKRPAVVGLSFGMAGDVGCLAESVRAVHEACPEARVMLGGRSVPVALRDAGYPWVINSGEVLPAVERLLAEPPRTIAPIVSQLCAEPPPTVAVSPVGERDTSS